MNHVEMPEIDATEAARPAEAGTVLLLDVRADDEWPIVTVGRSGNRSGQAAQALLGAGRDARNLTGGMREWAARGLPVIATDGSAGDVL